MSYVELLPAHEAVPSNERWHALRRQGVSASEIAAVLGISPWESPFSAYWRKVNGWETEANAEMTAGRYAERAIVDWFANECDPNGNLLLRQAGLYASRTLSWQLATPDALVCQDKLCGICDAGLPVGCTCDKDLLSLLECKYLVGGWDGWGEPLTDDIPVYYRAQCLWQLDVMGVDEVSVAAWHGAEFRHYVVRRDEADLRVMRAAGRDFMDRIAAGDPPPLDSHIATLRALKTLHPDVDDTDAEVDPDTAKGWRDARARKAEAEADERAYEAKLRDAMGRAKRAVCGGERVATRVVSEIAERTQTVAAHRRDYLLAPRERKAP